MTQSTLKLTVNEAAGLATVGKVAKKIPSAKGRTAELSLGKAQSEVGENEVVVLVLGRGRAVVGRRRVRETPDFDALREVLHGVDVAVERLAHRSEKAPPLTAAEAMLLDRAGLHDGRAGAERLESTRLEFEQMLGESLTLEDAAHELQVTTGRLRQRLGERTLYGVKVGRAWRIPRFQFAKTGRLVRNVDRVLPALRAKAHPLSVVRWFTSAHQDLVVGDGEPVTPLAWLEAGFDPATVEELAAEV